MCLAVGIMNGTNKAKDSPFRAENGKILLILVQNYVERELAAYRLTGSGLEDTGVRVKVNGHPASIRIGPR